MAGIPLDSLRFSNPERRTQLMPTKPIVFNPKGDGLQTLAHELTHTAQMGKTKKK